jgi:hypothetical protein
MERAKFTLYSSPSNMKTRQLAIQMIQDAECILNQIHFVINTALSRPKANLAIRPRAALAWQMTETVAQRAIVLQGIFSQGMTADLLFAFCPMISILEGPVSTFTFLFRPTRLHFTPQFEWHEVSVQISPVTDQARGSERYK